jgi:ATP-dependent DNA helicase PIF1
LLINGSTYHSKYKLYPPITETTRSKIKESHYSDNIIREPSLNISDEATMKLNYALDGINHLFEMVAKNRDEPRTAKCSGWVATLGSAYQQLGMEIG